jgi:alpha-mannosidase
MRTKQLLATFALVAAPALAGAPIDEMSNRLRNVSLTAIEGWQASPDIAKSTLASEADRPAAVDYDDSKWQTLALNEKLQLDSCWLRKRIVVPRYLFGEPVSGALRLRLEIDDYGFVWVNGESRGRIDWSGEVELAKDAKPGDVFVVAIKAINTGGPLRLMHAEVRSDVAAALQQSVDDLLLSFKVGQKLLSFDTYQTSSRNRVDPKIDRSTIAPAERKRLSALLDELATKIDVAALERGDKAEFLTSITRVRAGLVPIRAFAQRFTLYFTANAHIDAAWLWRERETVQVCRNTFASVMNMFKARPDFTYTQSSAAYYDWMERLYPDLFAQIKQHAKAGRWEVIGGMWLEPDCNLPSGESWARHLLYGKSYFRDKLGVDVTIGWNPDSFGYNWNMPQLYQNAGIDAFITQKIGWNAINVFPHRVFWWQAPDGSRILAYFPFDYVNQVDNPYQLVDWLRQFEANTGFGKLLILFGVGDHGGGPSLEMIDRIERLRSLDVFPRIEYGTAASYLGWLRAQKLDDVPVWNDELYLEYHEGTFTTQAKVKESNRRTEVLLGNAELLSTLASRHGRPYQHQDLEVAWKHVLFNQFHDILPGSSIREVYVDTPEHYKVAEEIGRNEIERSLETIAKAVDTSRLSFRRVVLVFNPLSWQRRDLVRVALPAGGTASYAIFDDTGMELPSQTITTGRYTRELLFIAESVPPLGYACFELREQASKATATDLVAGEKSIENQHVRVAVDSTTGWLASIFDKGAGREVLAGPGNELQLLEDKPDAWDAWNIGLTGVSYPSTLRSIEVVERGPVRTVLRVTRDYLKPGTKKEYPTEDFPTSFFTQDIVLYAGIDRIDLTTKVDWWEDKTMLKVAFPVSVSAPTATYEIPFGTIARSTVKGTSIADAKVEVPAQRWADLGDGSYGVSLLTRSKYGFDIKGSTMRLSLLRSPKWPDPTADRGAHSIEYALFPHTGSWAQAGTVQRGLELSNPLLVVQTEAFRGGSVPPLPPRYSFVALEPDNLVVSSLKRSEDGEAWLVRFYDATGAGGAATLTLPAPVVKAVLSDFLERDGTAIPATGKTLQVPVGQNKVVTVKLWLKQ